MAKAIKQYRYYKDNAEKNQPIQAIKQDFINGNIFNYPILQLGIQTLPGLKFYLNNNTEPIIIGHTGIYELDLENQMEIFKLSFEENSINAINENPNGYLIIDTLYEKEGA